MRALDRAAVVSYCSALGPSTSVWAFLKVSSLPPSLLLLPLHPVHPPQSGPSSRSLPSHLHCCYFLCTLSIHLSLGLPQGLFPPTFIVVTSSALCPPTSVWAFLKVSSFPPSLLLLPLHSVHPPQSGPSSRSLPSHLHCCYFLCTLSTHLSLGLPQGLFPPTFIVVTSSALCPPTSVWAFLKVSSLPPSLLLLPLHPVHPPQSGPSSRSLPSHLHCCYFLCTLSTHLSLGLPQGLFPPTFIVVTSSALCPPTSVWAFLKVSSLPPSLLLLPLHPVHPPQSGPSSRSLPSHLHCCYFLCTLSTHLSLGLPQGLFPPTFIVVTSSAPCPPTSVWAFLKVSSLPPSLLLLPLHSVHPPQSGPSSRSLPSHLHCCYFLCTLSTHLSLGLPQGLFPPTFIVVTSSALCPHTSVWAFLKVSSLPPSLLLLPLHSIHPPQSRPSSRSLPSHLHCCYFLCTRSTHLSLGLPQGLFPPTFIVVTSSALCPSTSVWAFLKVSSLPPSLLLLPLHPVHPPQSGPSSRCLPSHLHCCYFLCTLSTHLSLGLPQGLFPPTFIVVTSSALCPPTSVWAFLKVSSLPPSLLLLPLHPVHPPQSGPSSRCLPSHLHCCYFLCTLSTHLSLGLPQGLFPPTFIVVTSSALGPPTSVWAFLKVSSLPPSLLLLPLHPVHPPQSGPSSRSLPSHLHCCYFLRTLSTHLSLGLPQGVFPPTFIVVTSSAPCPPTSVWAFLKVSSLPPSLLLLPLHPVHPPQSGPSSRSLPSRLHCCYFLCTLSTHLSLGLPQGLFPPTFIVVTSSAPCPPTSVWAFLKVSSLPPSLLLLPLHSVHPPQSGPSSRCLPSHLHCCYFLCTRSTHLSLGLPQGLFPPTFIVVTSTAPCPPTSVWAFLKVSSLPPSLLLLPLHSIHPPQYGPSSRSLPSHLHCCYFLCTLSTHLRLGLPQGLFPPTFIVVTSSALGPPTSVWAFLKVSSLPPSLLLLPLHPVHPPQSGPSSRSLPSHLHCCYFLCTRSTHLSMGLPQGLFPPTFIVVTSSALCVHPPQSGPSSRSLPSHLHCCYFLCTLSTHLSMGLPQGLFPPTFIVVTSSALCPPTSVWAFLKVSSLPPSLLLLPLHSVHPPQSGPSPRSLPSHLHCCYFLCTRSTHLSMGLPQGLFPPTFIVVTSSALCPPTSVWAFLKVSSLPPSLLLLPLHPVHPPQSGPSSRSLPSHLHCCYFLCTLSTHLSLGLPQGLFPPTFIVVTSSALGPPTSVWAFLKVSSLPPSLLLLPLHPVHPPQSGPSSRSLPSHLHCCYFLCTLSTHLSLGLPQGLFPPTFIVVTSSALGPPTSVWAFLKVSSLPPSLLLLPLHSVHPPQSGPSSRSLPSHLHCCYFLCTLSTHLSLGLPQGVFPPTFIVVTSSAPCPPTSVWAFLKVSSLPPSLLLLPLHPVHPPQSGPSSRSLPSHLHCCYFLCTLSTHLSLGLPQGLFPPTFIVVTSSAPCPPTSVWAFLKVSSLPPSLLLLPLHSVHPPQSGPSSRSLPSHLHCCYFLCTLSTHLSLGLPQGLFPPTFIVVTSSAPCPPTSVWAFLKVSSLPPSLLLLPLHPVHPPQSGPSSRCLPSHLHCCYFLCTLSTHLSLGLPQGLFPPTFIVVTSTALCPPTSVWAFLKVSSLPPSLLLLPLHSVHPPQSGPSSRSLPSHLHCCYFHCTLSTHLSLGLLQGLFPPTFIVVTSSAPCPSTSVWAFLKVSSLPPSLLLLPLHSVHPPQSGPSSRSLPSHLHCCYFLCTLSTHLSLGLPQGVFPPTFIVVTSSAPCPPTSVWAFLKVSSLPPSLLLLPLHSVHPPQYGPSSRSLPSHLHCCYFLCTLSTHLSLGLPQGLFPPTFIVVTSSALGPPTSVWAFFKVSSLPPSLLLLPLHSVHPPQSGPSSRSLPSHLHCCYFLCTLSTHLSLGLPQGLFPPTFIVVTSSALCPPTSVWAFLKVSSLPPSLLLLPLHSVHPPQYGPSSRSLPSHLHCCYFLCTLSTHLSLGLPQGLFPPTFIVVTSSALCPPTSVWAFPKVSSLPPSLLLLPLHSVHPPQYGPSSRSLPSHLHCCYFLCTLSTHLSLGLPQGLFPPTFIVVTSSAPCPPTSVWAFLKVSSLPPSLLLLPLHSVHPPQSGPSSMSLPSHLHCCYFLCTRSTHLSLGLPQGLFPPTFIVVTSSAPCPPTSVWAFLKVSSLPPSLLLLPLHSVHTPQSGPSSRSLPSHLHCCYFLCTRSTHLSLGLPQGVFPPTFIVVTSSALCPPTSVWAFLKVSSLPPSLLLLPLHSVHPPQSGPSSRSSTHWPQGPPQGLFPPTFIVVTSSAPCPPTSVWAFLKVSSLPPSCQNLIIN